MKVRSVAVSQTWSQLCFQQDRVGVADDEDWHVREGLRDLNVCEAQAGANLIKEPIHRSFRSSQEPGARHIAPIVEKPASLPPRLTTTIAGFSPRATLSARHWSSWVAFHPSACR